MSEDLKKFMNAIGAIAETAGLLRTTLMANGFTREEAVHICSETITTMLNPANNRKNNNDD